MRIKSVVILFLALLASACASHGTRSGLTSGEIGCPTNEIIISEADMGWTTNTWKANCRGKYIIVHTKQAIA